MTGEPATSPTAAGNRASRIFSYENARPEVQALVPQSARRVLDLGCSSGAVGAGLKQRQAVEVVGVEIDRGYATDAGRRLDRVLAVDVEELARRQDLEVELGRFDCLIAADVLEHLREPWIVLERFGRLLEPDGTAVVSVPNVRYWETFWQLGRHGTWPRRHEGIFDSTHLRWFTGLDAAKLLEGAGFEVVEVVRQYRLTPTSTPRNPELHPIRHLRPLRPLFTFQYVLAGRRRG